MIKENRKFLCAHYDCQVCRKEHLLKVQWTPPFATPQEDFNIKLEEELKQALLTRSKTAFQKLHPSEEFDPGRVEIRESRRKR